MNIRINNCLRKLGPRHRINEAMRLPGTYGHVGGHQYDTLTQEELQKLALSTIRLTTYDSE